jgi:RimJ/RimL family protein N-acetyltransferase
MPIGMSRAISEFARVPTNEFGQPIGEPVAAWTSRPRPDGRPLRGNHVVLERLDARRHGAALYTVVAQDDPSAWTYMAYGPFEGEAAFERWLESASVQTDPFFYAILDARRGTAVGFASYLRIEPGVGVIEVGNVYFSRALRRSPAATEAMFLMMRHAFDDLGYRRYEWKCDALNAPSRNAAERFGFVYEGTFRQATIYKNRNRDTAWFSILDGDWPGVRDALERWLAPGNFDASGRQRQSLRAIRRP